MLISLLGCACVLQGFTHGIMIVGEYKGRKVSEAKPLLKKEMVERGEAMLYSEPESLVMSRSGRNFLGDWCLHCDTISQDRCCEPWPCDPPTM